ncbi:hypothetical protein ARMSODRAFT_80790 [Armillaria solidipes]|uniref:Uncharacterized protein n=1 Tax=Armillaria solidipes TaxID=1076256 RepID=A0A2H3B7E6_9AGAR|nr:hypothetical protein ARMSODRAFT_80790 [Armillaria solidipes]
MVPLSRRINHRLLPHHCGQLCATASILSIRVMYKGWEAMRNEEVMNCRGCCLEISHSTDDVAHDSSWRESPLEESSGAAHGEKSSEHGCSSDDRCITINPFMSHIVRPVHTSHIEARQGM